MQHEFEISAHRKRWVATSDFPLIWRNLDADEYVVYSIASGDTHLLNEVTAEVLRQLERSVVDFPELARNVANSLGTDLDQQTETYVAKLLVYLDQIGLVESVK